jgi:hypothetical protein
MLPRLATLQRKSSYAILYYGDSPCRRQINEIFKILDGRIRMVDVLSNYVEGVAASGTVTEHGKVLVE